MKAQAHGCVAATDDSASHLNGHVGDRTHYTSGSMGTSTTAIRSQIFTGTPV
ncbi:hypothetical protein AB0425_38550 [Actinosynnema sp. NPDC051121]